jgi:predicted transposase/invertase (TIGR01784 family)
MTMTPHDTLFKQVFSEPKRATEELRHVLAPELVERVDFTTLVVEPGTYVDDDLRERHTDLLFSAAIAGTTIRIYVLFEHQSTVDPWLPLRLLEYMLRIWAELRKQQPEARSLPAIVPVVLHHSDTGWRAATRFEALLELPDDAPAALLEHVPKFRFALDDLSRDEAIAAREASAYTRLILSALRDSRRMAMNELIRSWASLLREVSREFAASGGEHHRFWVYLLKVRGADEFATVDRSLLDPIQEETMQTIAQMLHEQGRQEGQQELLLEMLAQRFGEIPESLLAARPGAALRESSSSRSSNCTSASLRSRSANGSRRPTRWRSRTWRAACGACPSTAPASTTCSPSWTAADLQVRCARGSR